MSLGASSSIMVSATSPLTEINLNGGAACACQGAWSA